MFSNHAISIIATKPQFWIEKIFIAIKRKNVAFKTKNVDDEWWRMCAKLERTKRKIIAWHDIHSYDVDVLLLRKKAKGRIRSPHEV